MSTTQIKGSQILDGTITSADIDDTLEKDFTKVRVSNDDLTPSFLSEKLVAGPNISLMMIGPSGSNQALNVSAHVTGTWRDDGNVYITTSSVSIDSSNRPISEIGNDVFFFVSGSSTSRAVFQGDVYLSGSLLLPGDEIYIDGALLFSGSNLDVTGTISATHGFSGSLTRLVDGTSYLIAGDNVSILTGSNGSITLSAINKSFLYSVATIAESYTILRTDDIIALDSSNGTFTVSLEATPTKGRHVIVKDAMGTCAMNNIILTGSGKMIDGASSYTFSSNYFSLSLVYTGEKWVII